MRAYLRACFGTLWVVSAASADLCCLILVINEQLVFSQVGDTEVNCNFINKKGNRLWSCLWESERYRSVVCRISISGFLLVTNKYTEVYFMRFYFTSSNYLFVRVFSFKLI